MDIFINEGFYHETMQHRKKLWDKAKQLRSEDQIAYSS